MAQRELAPETSHRKPSQTVTNARTHGGRGGGVAASGPEKGLSEGLVLELTKPGTAKPESGKSLR